MNRKKIELTAAAVLSLALACVFSFDIGLLADETANTLLTGLLSRLGLSLFLLCLIFLRGQPAALSFPLRSLPRALLWCIPCLLVALANLPLSALLSGGAAIEHKDLIPLYAVFCLTIGVSEEIFFRAIVHDLCKEVLKEKKNGYLLAVLLSSAVFGLWHLINLFYGAGLPATLMQVGYSFLIGAMLAVTLDKTHNLWLCALLHALFDFNGLLVDYLGSGNPHDTVFWILTAVCGAFCAAHILYAALKENKRAACGAKEPPPKTGSAP